MLPLLIALLVAGAASGDSASALDAVSGVQLRDQYGQQGSLAEHRGHVVVVMVVTTKRLRNIKPWEKELRGRFEGIHYLRVADVPEGSRATYDRVAAKLVERVPDDVPVLIDVDGVWATELQLDTSRPNLLIVDADGHLVTTYRGRCTPELVAPVVETLEAVLGGS